MPGAVPLPVDRVATTLAILRVNHERSESHLRSYLPFVFHCLTLLSDPTEPVGAKPVQRLLSSEFGLDLPLGVVRSLLREAAVDGKLREDRRLYFLVEEALEGCNLNAQRGEFGRQFTHLAAAVAQAASERHDLDWSISRSKQLLIDYADTFSSDVLAAAMQGKRIPPRAPHDIAEEMFVVHEFAVLASDSRPEEFDFLVGLVKARMLSDALHLDIEQRQEEPLSRVAVFFDGPILLYVLGNAGEELQAPYVELVQMLKDQGAQLRCFQHSVVEAQNILDVAAARKSAALLGEQYHGDVVGFLVRSERSPTDIALQAERFEQDLRDLGIETVDRPDRLPQLQPDEEELEERIREYIPTIKPPALLKDVDSLMAIHVLRRGQTTRTIASSKAVLVTHNYALFKASARFFKERRDGQSVPHCVYDTFFTTLVWLHGPKARPDVPRELMLADAAAALTPTDELWRKYNDAIERLHERADIDEDDVRFLRYSLDAKSLLMGATRGDPEAFTDATVTELLELYRQRVVRDVEEQARAAREQLAAEQTAHADTRAQVSTERDKAIARRVHIADGSQRLARRFANGIFIALAVLVALGIALEPVGPIDTVLPGWVLIAFASPALLFGIWGAVAGGSVLVARDRLEAWLAARIEATILRFTDVEQE